MTSPVYPEQLDQLYALGDPDPGDWLDYPAQFGLQAEHIPDLIRMAVDPSGWELDAEEHPEVFANIHAWRALAQLKAVEAAPALTGLFDWIDEYDDDWTAEELPIVFGHLGPAAIPVLTAFLIDPSHGLYARIAAASSLSEICKLQAESAPDCAAAIALALGKYAENDPTLNGFLISDLADLKQPSTYPLVEEVYAAGEADEMIMGDWEDFQVEVGLLEQRITEPKHNWLDLPGERDVSEKAEQAQLKKQAQKEKNKRKQEKKSRKQNRKKKK